MNDTHERIREQLDFYVLGGASPQAVAEIRAHLATCEQCRAEVAVLRPVTDGLAQLVTQVDPPADLRDRVIRSATGLSAFPAEAVSGDPRRSKAVAPWLLAAASVVLGLALGGYTLQLRGRVADLDARLQQAVTEAAVAQQQMADARRASFEAASQVGVLAAPDLVRFDLAGQPNAPAATARAFWSRSRGMVFTASNLPAPPRGRVYQLWVLTADGTPLSVGLLEPAQTGGLTAVFQTPADLPAPAQVAVSDEPPGGVASPTGMIWVAGKPVA